MLAAALLGGGALLYGLRARARVLHGAAAAAAEVTTAAQTTSATSTWQPRLTVACVPSGPGWRGAAYRLNDGS
jgi:hypothetical protein